MYAREGWEAPSHDFPDMHDCGDMLVGAGFAEPVMDMERITLTFSSATRMLEELRGLGRNLHRNRYSGLRTRLWRQRLQHAISEDSGMQSDDGRLQLTFEVIYGHAFKPTPRIAVRGESTVSLQQMRQALSASKARSGQER